MNMLWKKQKMKQGNSSHDVRMGTLERLVDQGVRKELVWDTYVAATNMLDPCQQRLGLSLIRTYLRTMSKLSHDYVNLSRLIGGSLERGKVISNAINPLGKTP